MGWDRALQVSRVILMTVFQETGHFESVELYLEGDLIMAGHLIS